MFRYIYVDGLKLPMYGIMVLLGFSFANILLKVICKKNELDIRKASILELYGGIGAIIGAKFLSYLENFLVYGRNQEIELTLANGYSFYGGMLVGLMLMKFGSFIHKIDLKIFAQNLCFIVPIMHSFWKMGCFFSGCCYGIECNNCIGIVFPEDAIAPANIKLVPIQLIEVLFLILLASLLWFLNKRGNLNNPIAIYILGYSVPRFVIEFFRENNGVRIFSVAQIISILCIIISLEIIVLNNGRRFRR